MKKLTLGLMLMVSALSFAKMGNVEEEARLMAMSYKNTTENESMTSEVAMGHDVTVTILGFNTRQEAKDYFNNLEDETLAYLEADPDETVGVKFDGSSSKFTSRSIENGMGIEVERDGKEVAIIQVNGENESEVARARELVDNVL